MIKYLMIAFFFFTAHHAQAQPLSQKMARTAMTLWKDSFALTSGKPAKWSYDQGVILKGIEGIWKATGDPVWFNYIQKSMDFYVDEDGNIKAYKPDEYNIDHINNGRQLLLLYRTTGKAKYWKAASHLRDQLRTHPRTSEGGFWHKQIYPHQMWLDGLYMAQPFYAEYAFLTKEDTAFNDIAKQFILMERNARDNRTGLLYHGWDESRQQQWADKKTGRSPNFWGRAMGWYAMALVDVLDYFPADHPQQKELVAILNRLSDAVLKTQEKKTGLWYDVMDKPAIKGNYAEASASAMLVYAMAKGVRKGYLPASIMPMVNKGYNGITKAFIVPADNGGVHLNGTVSVSGLGGKPYRDGSVEYYLSEKVIQDDPKGVGAFLQAANELEMSPQLSTGRGVTVLLDNYFNKETKKDLTGQTIDWHYTWNDMSNGGFSLLGNIFEHHGACLATLSSAPNAEKLKEAGVYVIVDPDTEKESASPNYMEPKHVNAISNWVYNGGVLALFSNDNSNAEFTHFNTLANRFGIRFNPDLKNPVVNNRFEQGVVTIPPNHSIIKTSKKVFIKELSSIVVTKPAVSVLEKDGYTVVAIARWGKGIVFAIGDPWLYNEYIDGRKLPLEYENFNAAHDLVKWLLTQAKQ